MVSSVLWSLGANEQADLSCANSIGWFWFGPGSLKSGLGFHAGIILT